MHEVGDRPADQVVKRSGADLHDRRAVDIDDDAAGVDGNRMGVVLDESLIVLVLPQRTLLGRVLNGPDGLSADHVSVVVAHRTAVPLSIKYSMRPLRPCCENPPTWMRLFWSCRRVETDQKDPGDIQWNCRSVETFPVGRLCK